MNKFTLNEIERIEILIELNPTLKDEFLDDIALIETNPKKYWNSFVLDNDNTGRNMFIKQMQSYYNVKQLKLM